VVNIKFHGERLEEKRKDLQLTQKGLGSIVGVDGKTISAYENEEIFPRMNTLIKLIETLDISPEYLLGVTDKELPADQRQYIVIPKSYPPSFKADLMEYYKFLKIKYNVKG